MLKHPAETQARADALDVPTDGTMAPFPDAPEPFTARKHDIVVGRNKKGPTLKRVRVGVAPVIGSISAVSAPYDACADDALTLAERGAITFALNHDVHRMVCGSNAIDVQRFTDRIFRRHGVPALIGTDPTDYEQIIPGDRSSRCSVAVHRTGLSGEAIPGIADRVLAPHGASYGTKLPWSCRIELSKPRARLADHPNTGRSAVPYVTRPKGKRPMIAYRTTPILRTFVAGLTDIVSYVVCLASADDRHETKRTYKARGVVLISHRQGIATIVQGLSPVDHRTDRITYAHRTVFVGHRRIERRASVKRGATLKRQASAQRTELRTVADVVAPDTRQGWAELLQILDRSDRLKASTDHGVVTVTRAAKSGIYSATLPAEGWHGLKRWQTRTIDAMAIRLAS
jgi:hypothetical protein